MIFLGHRLIIDPKTKTYAPNHTHHTSGLIIILKYAIPASTS